jgi:hypothetical protein
MALWHISLATTDRMPLCKGERGLRKSVHLLARIATKVMLLFCIVDEHLHLVSSGDIESTRRLRQALHQSFNVHVEKPLAKPWYGPVKDRKHLLSLVRYHVIQVAKHKVQGAHPALWSGSCFQDIVGARVIEGLELLAAERLPRQQMAALACKEVGLAGFVPRPVSSTVLRELGMARIKAAASAALAADPAMKGMTRTEILARSAAAQLGQLAGFAKSEIRWTLELTKQSLWAMLKKRSAPPEQLNAVGTRLALEVEVERRLGAIGGA